MLLLHLFRSFLKSHTQNVHPWKLITKINNFLTAEHETLSAMHCHTTWNFRHWFRIGNVSDPVAVDWRISQQFSTHSTSAWKDFAMHRMFRESSQQICFCGISLFLIFWGKLKHFQAHDGSQDSFNHEVMLMNTAKNSQKQKNYSCQSKSIFPSLSGPDPQLVIKSSLRLLLLIHGLALLFAFGLSLVLPVISLPCIATLKFIIHRFTSLTYTKIS